MNDVCAAILAGGLGTRLRPALENTPKVLAPVGDRPFIAILLDRLESAGVKKVVLLTGFQANQVHRILGDRHGDMTLHYSTEATPLGTGGALRHALPQLESDFVLLTNGDSYCDVDLRKLISEHVRRQAEMSLTLTQVSDAGRFGCVETARDGRLTRFAEKQNAGGAGWINAGVYVLNRLLLEVIPQGKALSLERELLPEWIQCRRLYGFCSAGRFIDIGTPESYAAAASF